MAPITNRCRTPMLVHLLMVSMILSAPAQARDRYIPFIESLQAKQELATYMVTQMCFDAETLVKWLAEVRSRGIRLPVSLGLPGVMERMKLFRTSLRIGVGQSARFLRKQGSLAGALLKSSRYQPDDLVAGLSDAIADPQMGIEGFYLFSFNQVQATIAWQQEYLHKLSARDDVTAVN